MQVLAPPARTGMEVLTALSVALLVLVAAWAAADMRLIDGVPVWVKPAKFALSFVVLFGTLALVQRRLSPPWRDGGTLRTATAVMAVAMTGEMAYMIFMAAQAQASHFNVSTPFTATMYRLMGIGAMTLMVGVAVFGAVTLRDRGADLGPALRQGIGWGFVLSSGLTMLTAGYMGSEGTLVGVAAEGAARLPLTGWSATVGDIRPAHFLALHAMQALPLAGLWFDRRGIGPRAVAWAALGWLVLTLAVFAQALAGLPLIAL